MSEEVALAAADAPLIARQAEEIAQLQRKLAVAQEYEAHWRQAHADACIEIGRLDYALEQIIKAPRIVEARAWATKMRAEIAARTKRPS